MHLPWFAKRQRMSHVPQDGSLDGWVDWATADGAAWDFDDAVDATDLLKHTPDTPEPQ
ncbi:hypothetical protein LLE49_14195 [Alicyclobacillus tolerans]|uniref:hypothetical protein n=1 Tax=Alicyclobacillus tolerans TaxID=90970 RepID=UPI001F47F790|nr:hypothetical protein [Alicyclobacillus tolerans]MCF8565872.1 hypothetical protein [Alicyclobacillus tolerans]